MFMGGRAVGQVSVQEVGVAPTQADEVLHEAWTASLVAVRPPER